MKLFKIAVDGMGGDFAPEQIVKGTMQALEKFADIEVTIFGDKNKMAPFLKPNDRLKVVHTEHFLDMGVENPVLEYRKNKEHSMFKAMKYVADGNASAVVTAGPTQAVVVGGQLILKKMANMRRAAIAPIIPSYDGRGRILLDSGANVDLEAHHLLDLAIYAKIVAEEVLGRENASVGLINIGSEETKGRELERAAFEMFTNSPQINFYGNLEPTEVFTSTADIYITDGFTGNIVMKTMEGTAKGLGKVISREFKKNIFTKIRYLFVRKQMNNFKKSLDASEIGGALVIGLNHVLIKAHGSSSDFAFYNAIRQARSMIEREVIQRVEKALTEKEWESERVTWKIRN